MALPEVVTFTVVELPNQEGALHCGARAGGLRTQAGAAGGWSETAGPQRGRGGGQGLPCCRPLASASRRHAQPPGPGELEGCQGKQQVVCELHVVAWGGGRTAGGRGNVGTKRSVRDGVSVGHVGGLAEPAGLHRALPGARADESAACIRSPLDDTTWHAPAAPAPPPLLDACSPTPTPLAKVGAPHRTAAPL